MVMYMVIYIEIMVAMEVGKREFLSYHSNGCYEKENLLQKLESDRFELPLQKLGSLVQCKVRKNITTSKM